MRMHLWMMVSLCMRARIDSSGAIICSNFKAFLVTFRA